MTEIIYKEESYRIIGACFEVYKEKGCGFLEAVYQEAMAIEMMARKISFEREVPLPVHYKGQRLATSYRADFVCHKNVLVELKAISQLTGVDEAQVINEMKATGMQRALLVNFGAPSLEYKRRVFNLRESAQSAEEKQFN